MDFVGSQNREDGHQDGLDCNKHDQNWIQDGGQLSQTYCQESQLLDITDSNRILIYVHPNQMVIL